jgi:hypothetical protein
VSELTEVEIGFLQKLVDAGEAGRTIIGLTSRAGLLRLVQLKYVTEQSTSLDTVLYRITDAGRDALKVLRRGQGGLKSTLRAFVYECSGRCYAISKAAA